MDYSLPNDGMDLTGQTALVTGASAGLGVRFAKVLASKGASVALAARRVERLEELASEIRAAGGKAVAIAMDATDVNQLLHAVEQAEAALGMVSILVNNAGVPDAKRAQNLTLDEIQRVIDINIRAPFVLSCEVARRIMAHGKTGRIVNIASSAAYNYAGEGAALYSVSKAAVVRTTEVLAVEWAKYGINVNAIAPGAFESEMMDGMLSRVGDISHHFPRKRIGNPAQLDTTLLYLVSPASDAVTGTSIRVDDGQGSR
ncbi:MAG: SDR family NAD(P)-dependent oxidoreductase [Sphingobium sp.]